MTHEFKVKQPNVVNLGGGDSEGLPPAIKKLIKGSDKVEPEVLRAFTSTNPETNQSIRRYLNLVGLWKAIAKVSLGINMAILTLSGQTGKIVEIILTILGV